jgi:hypothetical protein
LNCLSNALPTNLFRALLQQLSPPLSTTLESPLRWSLSLSLSLSLSRTPSNSLFSLGIALYSTLVPALEFLPTLTLSIASLSLSQENCGLHAPLSWNWRNVVCNRSWMSFTLSFTRSRIKRSPCASSRNNYANTSPRWVFIVSLCGAYARVWLWLYARVYVCMFFVVYVSFR